MDNPWLLLVIGAVIGWVFQRLTELYSGPDFRIELGSQPILLPSTSSKVKFLHVNATNVKRNFFWQLLVNNHTANNSKCWVSFLDPVTEAELLKINGRWTSTKEPVDYRGGVDVGYALMPSREIIPPGESSEISVALKEEGKDESFGFNNESYLASGAWSKQEFLLDQNRYKIRIKISSEGKEWSQDFIMLNLGKTLKNFKLVSK